jgi:aminoglycoside 6'-N-acetyltransferase I
MAELEHSWIVRRATQADFPEWARMLASLHGSPSTEFLDEVHQLAALEEPYVAFLAFAQERAVGMIDARVRNYAEGSPELRAAYVEDLWVEPDERGKGIGRALLGKVEEWARTQGLQWLGSDTTPENSQSIAWHTAVGFKEVERLVVFGKPLT